MKIHKNNHLHRGIHAVHFGFLSGLIVITFLGTLLFSVFSPLWVTQVDAAVSNFAAGSFWNATTPAYTSLHPNSAALVSDITRQVSQFGASLTKDSGAPVYEVDQTVATISVIPWDCGSGILPGLANQWQAVPVPFYAVPGGSKSQMIIYQPSNSTVWEFGNMRNVAGQWQACTGGRISTQSDGVFPSPYGVSSSGLAALAGQVSMAELQAAQISHVIGLNLPQSNGQTWPATQSGGAFVGSPPMGLRLRLDPGLNVNNLGLSPTAATIARAAQTYGFVVWNRGDNVGVTAENPTSITARGLSDPYNAINTSLAGFPWDKLQALPQDASQSTNVPAITKFTVSSAAIKADSRVTLSWQASNVNRCAIPGLLDNLPASGTTESLPLKGSMTFILRCGGPAGTASSHVSVAVSTDTTNDPLPVLAPNVIIDQPYSGYANIMPELMSTESATQVYKVVYYEQEVYLYETAKPPFALNTARMENGKHTIAARVYYRDGRTEQKTAGFTVNNSPETLFATTQSGRIMTVKSIPPLWGALGILVVLAVMGAGTWWGWHKAHLS